jgi:NAD(P)-dependent dehydrogenase (short-subunit alcohol dehydrogenase family)
MAWTTRDIPDLSGRVAVVTGANGGLGLETARALAGAGARVVMAARSPEKTAAAEKSIRDSHPGARLETVPLDLASLASIGQCAGKIRASHERIDILVNNAGVMAIPRQETADGFEMQLGTNHLGHWALTAHLMPALLAAGSSRVVTVTSTARHMGRAVDPRNPHLQGNYGEWKAYGQSKLANFHFAIGLQRRLAAAQRSASSLCAHPGLSNTDLQARSVRETHGGFVQRFFHGLASSTGMSAAAGALPQLRAATDPSARGGELYAPRFGNNGPPVRRPILRRLGLRRAIDTLWEVSERETGIALAV